ncbi:unnamed protein product, partial [Staurois parvus]
TDPGPIGSAEFPNGQSAPGVDTIGGTSPESQEGLNPVNMEMYYYSAGQGWTDNSWGSRAIGDHRAPVSLPKLKKAYEKGTRDISWGPLLTPGPQAVPECWNGQSAPALAS